MEGLRKNYDLGENILWYPQDPISLAGDTQEGRQWYPQEGRQVGAAGETTVVLAGETTRRGPADGPPVGTRYPCLSSGTLCTGHCPGMTARMTTRSLDWVLVLPYRGAGVATAWLFYKELVSDPWIAKNEAKEWLLNWERIVEGLGLRLERISERVYPFLAVRVDAPNLAEFCRDQAPAVAAWFTGG